MNNLESFIAAILETRQVWLLQASEGMFAMLEDNDGNSYIPVWDTEDKAVNAAAGDWNAYTVTTMGFSELAAWLKELSQDEIDIAVAPEKEGEITAVASANLRKWVKQYDDNTYKESDEPRDVDEFDYGEGWAHEF